MFLKRVLFKFCLVLSIFFTIFDKVWFPRVWVFFCILDLSLLMVCLKYKARFNLFPYKNAIMLSLGSIFSYFVYALYQSYDGYMKNLISFMHSVAILDLSGYCLSLFALASVSMILLVYIIYVIFKNELIWNILALLKKFCPMVKHVLNKVATLLRNSAKVKANQSKNLESETQRPFLFNERKIDEDRLERLLKSVDVVGVTAKWGNGKTFIVDDFCRKHCNDYFVIKINVLAYKYGEIDTILVDRLSQLLSKYGIYSSATSEFKNLYQNSYLTALKYAVFGGWSNGEHKSDVFFSLSSDVKKLKKTILVIFEDIERVKQADDLKRILAVVNEMANTHFKVIYEYDKAGFKSLEIDRSYREKFIPLELSLTNVMYSSMVKQLMQELNFEEDMRKISTRGDSIAPNVRSAVILLDSYIEKGANTPVFRNLFTGTYSLEQHITTRKVKRLLIDLQLFLKENDCSKLDKDQIHTMLAFYMIKHFYYNEYEKLEQGISLIDLPVLASGGYNKKSIIEVDQDIQWLLNVFHYCDYVEDKVSLKGAKTVSPKKREYQLKIDHVIWHLLGGGSVIDTDYSYWMNKFDKEVILAEVLDNNVLLKRVWQNYCKSFINMNSVAGRKSLYSYKTDPIIALAEAYYVYNRTTKDWWDFLEFYKAIRHTIELDTMLLQILKNAVRTNYDLTLLQKCLILFNQAEIVGNLNEKREYYLFLDAVFKCVSAHCKFESTENVNADYLESIAERFYANSNVIESMVNIWAEVEEKFSILQKQKKWECREISSDLDEFIEQNKKLITHPDAVCY